jgi:DNA repair protein RadA/Sms
MAAASIIKSKSKNKTLYACTQCGAQYPKWTGNCSSCGAWNSLVEETFSPQSASSRFVGYAATHSAITSLADVTVSDTARFDTGLSELDRALGGGLVAGSVVLIGGDPGIGKSTLLLQALTHLSQHEKVLYVTGEESLQQVAMRAKRLELNADSINLLAETQVEQIIAQAREIKPQAIVVDSIQTIFTEILQSAPGSVGQVRESAAQLVRFAKQTHTALFLVGHVTKEGTLAGPRVLEHMVDAVLYFEGEQDSRYRVIRAIKNRFGAVNELGVFAMTDKGLREVSNPSAIFLSRHNQPVAGSVIMATWEGSRPMLVEVQALVSQAYGQHPRRITVGLEQNRLVMLLAVLQRHGGIATYDQDVFVNVVGGMRVSETASDLALLLAVISSLKNRVLPQDLMVFGEVGLAGEIRPVQSGYDRLREAAKHGFKRAIVPVANAPKQTIDDLKIEKAANLADVLGMI